MSDPLIFALIVSVGMLVQSFTGFAGSLLSLPLFVIYLNVREAVPAFALLQVLLNLILIAEAHRHVQWRLVGWLLVGGLAGVPIGAYGLATLPTGWIGLAVSILTLGFGILFLINFNIRIRPTLPNQVITGFLSGLLGGMISTSGPPVTIYAVAQRWDKNIFRSTLLAFFFALNVVGAASYFWIGLITEPVINSFLVAVLPGSLATVAGLALHRLVSPGLFRVVVIVLLILMGLLGLVRHVV